MITTIIFDLSEVLLTGLLGTERQIYDMYGLKVENSQWKIKEQEKFFHGEITEDEYFDAVIKKYGWQINANHLKTAVRKNFREIDGTRDILIKLKENGYILGLLSIHAKEWVDFCEEKYGYHKLFDSITYSFEVSVSKPDPKAFELIMDKLKVKPSECLFIDDYVVNIEAAGKLGITSVQFKSSEDLLKELRKLKIKI